MLCLDFERVVIERTIEVVAGPGQMMCVAWLLLVEARIVDEPLFGGGRADVGVQAMAIFVEGDKGWWDGSW